MKNTGLFVWLAILACGLASPASAQDAFEPDDAFALASALAVNDAPATHTFHALADEDWSVTFLVEGMPYSVRAGDVLADADVVLEIYQADGVTPVAHVDDAPAGFAEIWSGAAPASAYYYIRTFNYYPALTGPATRHTLRVTFDGSANLGLVYLTSHNALSFTWPASPLGGLQGYKVLRAASFTGPFQQINAEALPPDTTDYHDTGLEPLTDYYYKVLANDGADHEWTGIFSGKTTAEPVAGARRWTPYE
jgi:hypothetical protein